MKTFAWLVLAAVAYAELSSLNGGVVRAQETEEIDDTISSSSTITPSTTTPVFVAQDTSSIKCDGVVTCKQPYDPVCSSLGKTFASECEFQNAYCENPSPGNYIVRKGDCGVSFQVQSVDESMAGGDDTSDGTGRTGEGDAFGDVPVEIDRGVADLALKSDEPQVASGAPVEREQDPPPTDPLFGPPRSEETVGSDDEPTEATKGSREPLEPPMDETTATIPRTTPETKENGKEETTDSGKGRPRTQIRCDGDGATYDGQLTCESVTYAPVCTSYGRTFASECEFVNAYCDQPRPDFYVLYNGVCDDKDIPQQQVQSVDDQELWAMVFDVPIELEDEPFNEIDCADGEVTCEPTYAPVCTSRGGTFMNKCEFKNAFCEKPSASFFIVPCNGQWRVHEHDSDTERDAADGSGVSPDVMDVPVGIEEITIDANGQSTSGSAWQPKLTKTSPYCTLICPTGNIEVKPVCGSDAQSYINDCHLLSAKCENPALEKAHDGLCVAAAAAQAQSGGRVGSASSPSTSSLLATQELLAATSTSNQPASKPACNARCGRSYEPVCGSNGVTYGNPCLLDFATCQNPLVTKLGDGKCSELFPDALPPAANKSKDNNKKTSDDSICVPPVCPGTEAPVCGSDGETYLNVCLLQAAQCQHRELTLLHDGECGANTTLTCASLTCPLHTECREEPGTQVAYCADVCHADRCAHHEKCELLESECFTAPCSPVATCVPNGKSNIDDDF